MNPKSRTLIIAALLTVTAVICAAFFLAEKPAGPTAADVTPASAVKTSFPGLAPAQGEPDLPGFATARPTPGKVTQVQGPFDDRFMFEDLSFDGHAIHGAVRITSDVSDVLELQVLGGFYDEHGTLLGTARFVHHLGNDGHDHTGAPEEREEFSIPLPDEIKGTAASAAVGVPVLVNE